MYEDLKEYEGCVIAVMKNGWALQFVPEEHKTIEVCLEAIAEGTTGSLGLKSIIERVPEKFKTSEFYLEAVKRNGYVLGDVPEVMKSPKMCLVASVQDRFRFPDVPKEFLIYHETNLSYLRSWYETNLPYLKLRTWNWKKYVRISTEEELLKNHTREELLTSSNAYLRKLGLEYE